MLNTETSIPSSAGRLDGLRVVMIGAGNVATHLALALCGAGAVLSQVYSRTAESASRLAKTIGCDFVTGLDEVLTDADVYVISVKDDAIRQVAERLCPTRTDGLFVHTSGCVPLSVFDGLARHSGVLYPMQTFSKAKSLDFRAVPCFVEAGDGEAMREVQMIAGVLSSKVVPLSSDKRKYLHLAAVFACNFANHCYAVAEGILREQGLSFDVMQPLVEETAEKVRVLSPVAAQTGPAVRNDTEVMATHLSLMSGHPQWQVLYEQMSKDIYMMTEKGARR